MSGCVHPPNPSLERSAVPILCNPDDPLTERSELTGRISMMIGCVKLPGIVLNVAVGRGGIDVNLECPLEDEERELAALNALAEGKAYTHVDLDDEHAEGLVALLRRAIEVRALNLTGAGGVLSAADDEDGRVDL